MKASNLLLEQTSYQQLTPDILNFSRRRERETLRKIEPKTRLDFDMLYDLVEKWRLDRIDYAKKRFFRAARCVEGYLTVEKTVEMLNAIDKQRTCVRAAYRNRKRARFLTVNCKPVRWIGYRQKQIEMVSTRNQKARELKMIYDSLTNYTVTRGERMEILTMLRKALEHHNCVPAFDLIRLMEQELDYLTRGLTKEMSLDYFRERIVCEM